jgi:lysophospholipase
MGFDGEAPGTLVSLPGNEPPRGLECKTVPSLDGTLLRAAAIRPPRAKGTIVIAPGRGDFIERYFETINDLAARGFAVAIFDFRGQGGSERPFDNSYRSFLRSFAEYDADLSAVMTGLVLPDCPPPYYALGHSTGAHVILRALRTRTWFEKAVLSAPLLGVHTGAWPMFVARLLSSAMTACGLGWAFLPGQLRKPLAAKGFPGNDFTSDLERFTRDLAILEQRPELGIGGPSFAWLRAALKSIDELHSPYRTKTLKAKTLIVAAGRDRVVRTEGARDFAKRVPGVSFIVIPESLHEILVEATPIREQFLAAFDTFIGTPDDR